MSSLPHLTPTNKANLTELEPEIIRSTGWKGLPKERKDGIVASAWLLVLLMFWLVIWLWQIKNDWKRYTWRNRLRDKKKAETRERRRIPREDAECRDIGLASSMSNTAESRRPLGDIPILRYRGPSEAFTEDIELGSMGSRGYVSAGRRDDPDGSHSRQDTEEALRSLYGSTPERISSSGIEDQDPVRGYLMSGALGSLTQERAPVVQRLPLPSSQQRQVRFQTSTVRSLRSRNSTMDRQDSQRRTCDF